MVSSLNSFNSSDPRSTSVAELRRKAQEHSVALLHAAAAAGLTFTGIHFPPISFQQTLNIRHSKTNNIDAESFESNFTNIKESATDSAKI
jgi:hypothetical protein